MLYNIKFDNNFLNMTPKAQETKEKQINLSISKLKTSVYQINRVKKATHRIEENICNLIN